MSGVVHDENGLIERMARIREPVRVLVRAGQFGLADVEPPVPRDWQTIALLPPLYPEWLGERSFRRLHGLRFAYVTGAMARGIASPALVTAAARAGAMGFYGAAGLPLPVVEGGLDTIASALDPAGLPWGANLIHSPNEPELERAVAELYVARGVRRVSASAYMELTAPIVRYAVTGLRRGPDGTVVRAHHVFAKVSRPETARRFLEPAPERLLAPLVEQGALTPEEAALAREIPLADTLIVESDSGGHTDNRPLGALFPTLARLRDRIVRERGYATRVWLGAAGGLGDPASVAAAYALGADFVLTGSVNQAAVESGLSEAGRRLLAQAGIADVTMAPAADMFELGVDVQVLSRGTLFASRARKLRELYRRHGSLDDLSDLELDALEARILGKPVDDVWSETEAFFGRHDPGQVERAARDPRHKMALVFRWYLGRSSRWAITGEPGRGADFQIWCGPAMGAFNAWVQGSFLEAPERRSVAQIAWNLMEGAARRTRALQLRSMSVPVPPRALAFLPRPLA